jgi:ribonuclease BN (tRNA processing enzyme)
VAEIRAWELLPVLAARYNPPKAALSLQDHAARLPAARPEDCTVRVTLIPSGVSASGDPGQYTSSALINDTVVIDAGCIGFWRTAQDQARIRHVLLTHSHMDHLASLPIFLENAYEGKADCVTLHASATVLECCQRDLFNDRIWPDFIALSKGDRPFLRISPIEAGQTVTLEGLHITAVEVNHVVPTLAFLVNDGTGTIGFVTDTGPTDEVWQLLNARNDLRALFLEATFPGNMTWLADLSKHLTPATFAGELSKLNRVVPTYAIHLKARYHSQVTAELDALGLPQVVVAQFNHPYTF